MKRTSVPGTRFADKAVEITDMRMALIGAVQALLMIDEEVLPNIGFHSMSVPNMLAGGHCYTAESGFNPRDTAEETAGNQGMDVPAVRNMFYQAGYRWLIRGDGSRVELTPEYMSEKIREAMEG